MSEAIDWTQRAKEALGISHPYQSTGDAEMGRLFGPFVPRVAAALAAAYGEGYGRGKAER